VHVRKSQFGRGSLAYSHYGSYTGSSRRPLPDGN